MDRFLVSKLSSQKEKNKVKTLSSLQPTKFCSWNCNGFSVRLNTENKENLDAFVQFIHDERPDVLTLQEVRMTRASESQSGTIDHSKKSNKCLRNDADLFAMFKRRVPEYTVHLSLAGKKYAGQAIFVHNSLQTPVISYTFEKTGSKRLHDNEGRIIIAEFDHVIFLSTYTPNNGVSEDKFQRRRDWDRNLKIFLTNQRALGKVLVYQGDLNVAAEDADLSGDPQWWRSQCVSNTPDPNDCGQPGSTINEQRRFQHILHAADLIDAWRRLHPHTCTNTNSADNGNVNINEPVFTWRGASGPRYFGKGMRIDYHLVSGCLLREGLIERADVNGWGTDLQGFMGSDHCPVTLTLVEKWWLKREHCDNNNMESKLFNLQQKSGNHVNSPVSVCVASAEHSQEITGGEIITTNVGEVTMFKRNITVSGAEGEFDNCSTSNCCFKRQKVDERSCINSASI